MFFKTAFGNGNGSGDLLHLFPIAFLLYAALAVSLGVLIE